MEVGEGKKRRKKTQRKEKGQRERQTEKDYAKERKEKSLKLGKRKEVNQIPCK